MVFEHRLDLGAYPDRLLRIAEQVADQADIVAVRQLDQDDDVRPVTLERGVHRVPDALPTDDAAAALDLFPAHGEGPAAGADPLRPPLPAAAGLERESTRTNSTPSCA